MQQVASGARFSSPVFDAPAQAAVSSFATEDMYVAPDTSARSRRRSAPLQMPRGERRLRRRPFSRRWTTPLLTFGALCMLAGAAIVIVPFDLLHRIDFSRVFEAKATALLVAAGFGIDQVSITGQRFASDNDIYDALDLTNVRTFAEFDSEAALKRIDRIPWVESAQITRVYPSSLDIVIRERAPAILWTRGSKNYLVDATGRLLGPAPQAVQWDLPRIAGEGAARAVASMFAAVRHYPAIEREYAYGERVGERRWRIVLKNGTMLDLAADREVEGLGEIANSPVVAPAIKGAPMIIDVRTPGRITMRPAQDKPARTAALDAPLPSGQQLRVSDER